MMREKYFIISYGEVFRLMRFFIVGAGATLLHLSIAAILFLFFHEWSSYVVNLIAFSFALIFSYIGHKKFTFGKEGSLIKFILVALVGFLINNFFLSIMLHYGNGKFVSIFVSTVLVPAITYIFSLLWVYK